MSGFSDGNTPFELASRFLRLQTQCDGCRFVLVATETTQRISFPIPGVERKRKSRARY
jgi:hypothetical protein